MDDYRTKRRFRQRKLSKQGFYELRRQRCRARRRTAMQAISGTLPSLRQIVHPENLIRVFDDLRHRAGHAAGPDGITYNQLGRREVGQIMRDLSQDVLKGAYEPSRARHVRIEKANGRGFRTLKLRSIVYRVIAKALADALTPFFDGMFLPGSHGFRPDRGPWSMLLDLERTIGEQQRCVIAQDDIKQAFDNVPIDYAVELYGRYLPDEALLVLIEQILRGHRAEQRTAGIDQGSALSPLTLNVVLHHALDQKFSENAVHPPWLRYADNVVYLCQSVHEGMIAIQAAQDLLQPIGMTLKGTDGPPVDLSKGQQATILGLCLQWDNGQVLYYLTDEAWTSLEAMLSQIRTYTSPEAADQVIKGWMEACGPAFEGKQETPILDRVLEIAAEAGYRELSLRRLKQYLQSSRDRWACRRRNSRHVRKVLMGIQDHRGEAVAPLTADRPGISTCPRPRAPQTDPAALSAPLLHEYVGQQAGLP